MGKSATGGERVKAALNAEQAIQLRIGGATFRAIAFQLKISPAQAQRYVARHLEATRARTADQVEQLRQIECERMDALVMSHWTKRAEPKSAMVIVHASRRRAELLGLDAPLRLEDTTPQAPTGEPLDLSRLSVEELRQYEALVVKMRAPLLAADATLPAEVSEVPCGEHAVEDVTEGEGPEQDGTTDGTPTNGVPSAQA